MSARSSPLIQLLVAVLLLATPPIAFVLIASAATADAGLQGWLLLVVLPLGLFGVGIVLLARRGWPTEDAPTDVV